MIDTTSPTPQDMDWRAYAARIRNAALALQLEKILPPGKDQNANSAALDGDARHPDRPAPVLSHRQQLITLQLAATLQGGEARLAEGFSQGAITAITGVPYDLVRDLVTLLPAAMPAGWITARPKLSLQRPGVVFIVEPGVSQFHAEEELESELTAALRWRAPVVVILPEGVEPNSVLGPAKVTAWPFHPVDREIIVEFFRLSWAETDPEALRALLPPDDRLAEMALLPFALALRSGSAEEGARLLAQADWPDRPSFRTSSDGTQRTKASRTVPANGSGIPLAELAGLGLAREIALGITEDLRAWAAGDLDWSDVHRGLLIAGPPGCGKTELARAMAREAGIHLEAGSYAGWQAAGHLGDMLKAMQASFRNAAKNAPSVLFIDEIDAFGSRVGGSSDRIRSYDTKVISGLLEQLDGLAGREGVTVIGACNHPGQIDPAIRRAGRFDALVQIGLPDARDLARILRQHLGENLPGADLQALSQLARGRSGADCAAAVRAARAKARRARRPMTHQDLISALSPDHLELPPAMRQRAAIHEAGHAIVTAVLKLGAVKALRLGPAGGETLSEWRPGDLTPAEVHRHCVVYLSGRAAELLMLGDAGGGAGGHPDSDLARASRLLLACELSLGLGEQGHLSIGAMPDLGLIPTLPAATRAGLQRRLDRACHDAQEILCQHHELLEELATDLEARGFIGEDELAGRLALLKPRPAAAAFTASGRMNPAGTFPGADGSGSP